MEMWIDSLSMFDVKNGRKLPENIAFKQHLFLQIYSM